MSMNSGDIDQPSARRLRKRFATIGFCSWSRASSSSSSACWPSWSRRSPRSRSPSSSAGCSSISGVVGLVTTFMARATPGLLVGAALGRARDRRRPRPAGLAGRRRRLAHAAADRVLHDRGRRHHHVRARAQEGSLRAMGLDAGERRSSISFWRRSFSPGCRARRPGRSASWSASTCCSAAHR